MNRSPFDFTKNRVFLTLGHTNERFCLPNGIEVRYEKMLHDHLKRQGYETIIFVSDQGVFVLDEYSALMLNPQGQPSLKKAPASSPPPPGLLKHPTGISFRRCNSPSIKKKQPAKKQNWLYPNMNQVTQMVPLIRRRLNENPNTAVVFANDNILSSKEMSQTNESFIAYVKNDIHQLPTENRNILIFNFPGSQPSDELLQRGWGFLYRGNAQNQKGVAQPVNIGPPESDEIANYLLNLHLRESIPIEWSSFDLIVRELTAYIKREDLKLNVLSKIVNFGRIDLKVVQSMTGLGVSKSAGEQLDELIGMDNVKTYFKALKNRLPEGILTQSSDRQELQRLVPPPVNPALQQVNLHLALKGNPGTGKSTVAKLYGAFLREAGILPIGHTIKVTRADLVAGYVGQTALKTQEAIQKALGGVLFIDEAYSLFKGDENTNDFGHEAIDTLVEAMTDLNGRFAVVIAGYPRQIDEFIQNGNPGLTSRLTQLTIEDYKPEHLEQIFRDALAKRRLEPLSEELEMGIPHLCRALYGSRDENFGNARTFINLADDIQANFKSHPSPEVVPEHVPEELQPLLRAVETTDGVVTAFQELIGLENAKSEIKNILCLLQVEKERTEISGRKTDVTPGHFLFFGSPGTGKTTAAEFMAEQFFSMGLVESRQLHRTTATQLLKGYVGQTGENTTKFLKTGLNKVIFIDEAHQLGSIDGQSAGFGREVLNVLVPFMEDNRDKCIVILAGYEVPIMEMLRMDHGAMDRFKNHIRFDDFNGEEMLQIFKRFAYQEDFKLHVTCEDELIGYFEQLKKHKGRDFANARTVRNYFDQCKNRQALRLLNNPEHDKFILVDEDLS